jgi:hypothetical protein
MADGVGVVPMHFEAVTMKVRLDPLHLRLGFGAHYPVPFGMGEMGFPV